MAQSKTADSDDSPKVVTSKALEPATTQQRIVSAFAGALMVSLIGNLSRFDQQLRRLML
jgi:hypothetical protein